MLMNSTLNSIGWNIEKLLADEGAIYNMAANRFQANGFRLNEEKTIRFVMGLRDIPVSQPRNVKLLGFHLEPGLSWRNATAAVCDPLSRAVYVLRRLRDTISLVHLR